MREELKPQMEESAEEFVVGFYDHILGYGKTTTFLKNEKNHGTTSH